MKKAEATKIELDKLLTREIAVLQIISLSNILDIYQIVETDEKCFIAYELTENETLMEYMNLNVCLPEQALASFSTKCVKVCLIATL